jgi:glycosyltransferase involved in cell wall biosynthesis
MLLSVCIPTFNRRAFIRLSARYWLEQMAPFQDRVELLIADNASTDDTVTLLRTYQKDSVFRLIERPENLGFNRSVYDLVTQHARGDYVWVCGDDDYLNRGALVEVIRAMEDHRDLDHFSITTQFVPEDHPPDLEREDPRESAYLHRPRGNLVNDLLPRTMDLLTLDSGAFSGFYSSIWRRTLAAQALSGEFLTYQPFQTLEATLPYSTFVAHHRLQAPCYRIGCVALTVVHTICWPQYASLFRLKIMPDAYDLYEKQGVSPSVLWNYRQELLDHWPRAYFDLIRRRGTAAAQGFSFLGYLARSCGQIRFWKELYRAFIDLWP